MKKVFLENLPKWNGGKNSGNGREGTIDWRNSIGHTIEFEYNDIKGFFKIIDYEIMTQLITLKYLENESFKISSGNLKQCKLKGILKEELLRPKYNESNPKRIDLRNLPLNSLGIDWTKVSKDRMIIPFFYNEIIGELQVIDYKDKNLKIKYLNKASWISTETFKKCMIGDVLGKVTKDFKIEVGYVFKDDKRNLTIIEKEYRKRKFGKNERIINEKWYKYKCNICGWTEGWIAESNLLNNINGCSCCSNRTTVEGINDIPTTAPEIVKFFQGGYDEAKMYTKCSNKEINPICPDCGRVREKKMNIGSIYNNHSIGCSCGDGVSYPEKFMFNVLEQLNLNFKIQLSRTTFKWCDKYRYDFYFEYENNKYIIETHGGQHYEEATNFKMSLQEVQENDKIKKELAIQNGIKEGNYIVINCSNSDLEYIKNKIINSELNKLFNLNNVDWIKCGEFALNNLVKKVCDIKKDNPNYTTSDISYITGIDSQTIRKYLVKGTELSWVNYSPKDETLKSGSKNGKALGKKVEVFKDNISLGIFESCAELSRQSEVLFGVRLVQSKISNNAKLGNDVLKLYKGFKIKYI